MGLAQGVAAGLATGGRFSGLSNALKMVLKNQQLNKAMQNRMDITREVTDRDIAMKMLALNKLAGPTGEMPEEMVKAGYRQFGGKVYRTSNLGTPERYPGENATMQAGYIQARLGAIDNLIRTAPDQNTKIFLQKEKVRIQQEYASGLPTEGIDLEPSGWDKFNQWATATSGGAMNMLGNMGNSIMDMLDNDD
jgi:hypothetical protein